MVTKSLLAIMLAACGAEPDEFEPTEPAVKPIDQHFCCQSVDPKTKTGEGCETIGSGKIDLCAEVLYCSGDWAKHDGKVYCL
jgi:hypothetical protein